jgi:hypothetical protein
MQKLITYNAEDCDALARLEERLLYLFLDREGARATAPAEFAQESLSIYRVRANQPSGLLELSTREGLG